MTNDLDKLEAGLRRLARDLNEQPGDALLARTKTAAHAVAPGSEVARLMAERRRWLLLVLAVFTAVLPIPALFLWADWQSSLALLKSFLSPHASEICAGIYLWMKAGMVVFIYALLVPAAAWLALQIHAPKERMIALIAAEG